MGRCLLKQEGVKFLLSERFCQDPVETFFSHQRSKGGHSDNPTVKQFLDNTESIRIQKSAALAPLRGNCSRKYSKREQQVIEVDNTPLKKRKRSSKS